MGKRLELRGEISGLHPLQSPVVLSNLSLAHMSINNCDVPLAANPKQRATLRDISIFECEHYACSVHGARLQDIVVTDVRGSSKAPSFLRGCVFSHVTLRGGMGGVWFSPIADSFHPHLTQPYLAANAAEYRNIDWALDITEARFGHFFSLAGIPASLVRRNPARHWVMTREAAQVLVKEAAQTIWTSCAQQLIELGLADTVLVVAGSTKSVRGDLEEAAQLRDRGLLV